jgi:hypothetical protein
MVLLAEPSKLIDLQHFNDTDNFFSLLAFDGRVGNFETFS